MSAGSRRLLIGTHWVAVLVLNNCFFALWIVFVCSEQKGCFFVPLLGLFVRVLLLFCKRRSFPLEFCGELWRTRICD